MGLKSSQMGGLWHCFTHMRFKATCSTNSCFEQRIFKHLLWSQHSCGKAGAGQGPPGAIKPRSIMMCLMPTMQTTELLDKKKNKSDMVKNWLLHQLNKPSSCFSLFPWAFFRMNLEDPSAGFPQVFPVLDGYQSLIRNVSHTVKGPRKSQAPGKPLGEFWMVTILWWLKVSPTSLPGMLDSSV